MRKNVQKVEVTQSLLKTLFDYREGELWHKDSDLRATSNPKQGYKQVRVMGQKLPAHRMIYLLLTGTLPALLDHANRIRTDNRIENLREASHSQNSVNSSRVNRATGLRGVAFCKRRNRYYAQVTCNGLRQSWGYFETGLEAAEVYDQKAVELFGEFAVTNFKSSSNGTSP